jgi:hypothetical protein
MLQCPAMRLHALPFCPCQPTKQSLFPPGVVYAGNFFFAGARTFFNSLEAAIFLFSRVARIPEGSSVMPVISTEERITLGAVLSNGLVIKGQNQISHPSVAGPFQLALHLLTFEMSIYENKPLPDCIVHSNSFNPISFVRLLVLPGSSVSQGLSATITLCRRAQVSTS